MTALAVWFLFIHAPPILIQRKIWLDPGFSIHLVGAYGIYLVCIFNTLFTPMSLPNHRAKGWHIRAGKAGMILGYIGFLFGLYCSFWPFGRDLPPRSFAFGITAGGCAQVACQFFGMRSIQRYYRIKDQIEELLLSRTSGRDGDGSLGAPPTEDLNVARGRDDDEQLNNEERVVFSSYQKAATENLEGVIGDTIISPDGVAAAGSTTSDQHSASNPSTITSTSQLESLEEEKRAALKNHITSMLALFVMACGSPAIMRLVLLIPAGLQLGSSVIIPLAFASLHAVFAVMTTSYTKGLNDVGGGGNARSRNEVELSHEPEDTARGTRAAQEEPLLDYR